MHLSIYILYKVPTYCITNQKKNFLYALRAYLAGQIFSLSLLFTHFISINAASP